MRRCLILGAIAAAIAVVAAVVLVTPVGGDESPPAAADGNGLDTKTVSAGEIGIKGRTAPARPRRCRVRHHPRHAPRSS